MKKTFGDCSMNYYNDDPLFGKAQFPDAQQSFGNPI